MKTRVVQVFEEMKFMWYWTVIFLLIALSSAALGYTEVAIGASYIAEIFFAVFVALWIASRLMPKLRFKMKSIRKI